jgi:NAD(P)-dependent dehydrogenase (short-subunit alcohol dehydrogenase family)
MSDRRVAIVTGASRGIGEATAWRLAAAGWHVYATARNPDALKGLASERMTPVPLDLNDDDSIQDCVQTVLTEAGRIDALVSNAGYSASGALELFDLDDVRKQFQTNVFGPLRMSQLVLPAMRAQGSGRIVHLGTVMGRVSFPLLGAYSSSKAALESLNDALRLEARRFGVRVVMVIPGTVRTEFDQVALDTLRERMPDESSPHYESLEKLDKMIADTSEKGIPPEDVAAKVQQALEARFPRSVYVLTPEARLAMRVLARLPVAVRDPLMRMPLRL